MLAPRNGSKRQKRIPRTLFKLLSLWSLFALLALLLVQALPVAGPLLAEVGAAFVAGWLVHVGLVSLLLDSLAGRLPRIVALLPVVVYSGYYAAYWQQDAHIEHKSIQLKHDNPGKIFDFDPAIHSLVMAQADKFVASHFIPIVYTYDASYRPDSYVSYRLIAEDQLPQLLQQPGVSFRTFSVYFDDEIQPNIREVQIPERPARKVVSVAVRYEPGNGWRDWNIGEEVTEIDLEARKIGVFRSGFVERLPKFPLFAIGCRFLADPAIKTEPARRKCFVDLVLSRSAIDSAPEGLDRTRFDEPVSIMLGVRRFAENEIKAFRGFDNNLSIADRGRVQTASPENEAFEALRALIDGQSPTLPWTMGYWIASNPDRLKPYAAGMAKRLIELWASDKNQPPTRRQQTLALAAGLSSLKPSDFAPVANGLIDALRRDAAWADYPTLYLRMSDLGARIYPFYRDRFLNRDASAAERLLASIAICRIGQADNELMSAMKVQFSDPTSEGVRDDNFKASLFATLLKLGQETYLKANDQTYSVPLKAWYDAVLAEQGKTETGPNNCMPLEWPRGEYLPPNLAPSLNWLGGVWKASVRKQN